MAYGVGLEGLRLKSEILNIRPARNAMTTLSKT